MKIADLMKTAQRTGTRIENRDGEVRSRLCPNCRAARPDDRDMRVCAFCGYEFMTTGASVMARGDSTK